MTYKNYKYCIGDMVVTKDGTIGVIRRRTMHNGYQYYGLHEPRQVYKEEDLELVQTVTPRSYVDDLKEIPLPSSSISSFAATINDKGDNFMVTIKDIRLGTKTILVPKENAAPDRVECQTVVVTTKDGKEHEAVCYPGDEFDLERGIEIACLKAHFGGANAYNKKMREAVKFYNKCKKKRENAKKADEEKARIEAKKKANAAKKAARARQKRIDEMSEAFLIALNKHDTPVAVSVAEVFNTFTSESTDDCK